MRPLSSLGGAALYLAVEFGLGVLPCVPRTKIPLVGKLKHDGSPWRKGLDHPSDIACRGGFHRATSDAETICAWWDRWPHANVGVRLGDHLRLGLIEGDTAAANARIEEMAREWPATWTYHASRGLNRVFQVPAGIAERPVRNLFVDEIGVGFEVKTGAGFFVAPPSVHPSGHVYKWCADCSPAEVPLAEMPAGVADIIRSINVNPALAHPTPTTSTSPPATLDVKEITDALRYLDADDYATWIEVGLALKASGDARARRVWDGWSATSDKYDAASQGAQWAAMVPTTITVASIIHHARTAGWSSRSFG